MQQLEEAEYSLDDKKKFIIVSIIIFLQSWKYKLRANSFHITEHGTMILQQGSIQFLNRRKKFILGMKKRFQSVQ